MDLNNISNLHDSTRDDHRRISKTDPRTEGDSPFSESYLPQPVKKHSVVVALRENGIYEHLIPIVRNWSAEQGRALQVITVPRGSSQSTIQRQILENASSIKNSFLVADR